MEAQEVKDVADTLTCGRIAVTSIRIGIDKAVLEAQEIEDVEHSNTRGLVTIGIANAFALVRNAVAVPIVRTSSEANIAVIGNTVAVTILAHPVAKITNIRLAVVIAVFIRLTFIWHVVVVAVVAEAGDVANVLYRVGLTVPEWFTFVRNIIAVTVGLGSTSRHVAPGALDTAGYITVILDTVSVAVRGNPQEPDVPLAIE